MAERVPFMTHNFALVVCRHPDGRWLAVKETRNRGWWLPAGLVSMGETFSQAAHREVLEEAGIRVELKGILRVEHSVYAPTQARMRVTFFAVPLDPTQAVKKKKDKESEEAAWVTLEELKAIARNPPGLRGPELYEWGSYLEKGGSIAPICLLCREDEKIHSEGNFFTLTGSTEDVQTLITGIENADEFAVRKVLLMGVDCNLPINEKLWTPLHLACFLQNENIIFMILIAGGDPSAVTHKSRSVVHFAAQTNLNIMNMVLAKLDKLGVKNQALRFRDFNGDTPLMFAATKFGKGEMVNLLIKHGAEE
jgi:8-oxo-dGTP pyrophosphatase MutT (NUDIX family)